MFMWTKADLPLVSCTFARKDIMDKEMKTEMENAQKDSGDSGESSEILSDESANKGGRPKRYFDPEDPFNPTFGLEYERFCEEALAWLQSWLETMREIVSHKKCDWPLYVMDEPSRAAFRLRCKNYKLDLGRTGLVYSRRLRNGTCEYYSTSWEYVKTAENLPRLLRKCQECQDSVTKLCMCVFQMQICLWCPS